MLSAPSTGVSKTQVLFNFGRADQLDLAAIRRLVKSLSKLLGPDETAVIGQKIDNNDAIDFLGSRQFRGSWLLDGMRQRLKIDSTLKRLLTGRNYQMPVERFNSNITIRKDFL
jgi:hypothetical protein